MMLLTFEYMANVDVQGNVLHPDFEKKAPKTVEVRQLSLFPFIFWLLPSSCCINCNTTEATNADLLILTASKYFEGGSDHATD